jgi:hypothetical protein
MQNFNQLMWYHEILYADRCSVDEHILLRPFLWETKNMNVNGGCNLKLIFCFIDITHELFSDKFSLVQ